MRIAVLGSVALPVPPPAQGGTEWIAYFQAAGLAKLGHEVILFAARGSKREDGYELVEVGGGDTVAGSAINRQSEALITNSSVALPSVSSQSPGPISTTNTGKVGTGNSRPEELLSAGSSGLKDMNIESSRALRKENVYLGEVVEQLFARKDDFDIVLNNMRGEAVLLPIAKYLKKPFVNVMHLPLFPELASAFQKYNTHVITISNAQRKGFDGLNYLATVYNCVDTSQYVMLNSFQHPQQDQVSTDFQGIPDQVRDDNNYLLMMGTIGRHKNQAGAISVAKKAGMKLVLAGKIRDKDYFEELKKDIDGETIRYFGELSFDDKLKLYQNARVFIFPILWEEPFGLVMIEAMACGTPVVAYNNGAIPEVVVSGKNGFVVESGSEDDMVSAVKNIGIINREDCRKYVEENFSIEKIVKDYEKALLTIR